MSDTWFLLWFLTHAAYYTISCNYEISNSSADKRDNYSVKPEHSYHCRKPRLQCKWQDVSPIVSSPMYTYPVKYTHNAHWGRTKHQEDGNIILMEHRQALQSHLVWNLGSPTRNHRSICNCGRYILQTAIKLVAMELLISLQDIVGHLSVVIQVELKSVLSGERRPSSSSLKFHRKSAVISPGSIKSAGRKWPWYQCDYEWL